VTLRLDKRWIPMLFPLLGVGIIAVDNTVLDLALPAISRDLGASTEELQWAINAYVLAFAGPLLATGTLADRWGRKRMLLIGAALFGLTSLAASLSTATWMLIAFRGAQGLAGAILLPATLALLRATFVESRERTVAIGVWSAVYSLGAMLGPLIGGALIDSYSWRAVFLINVPVAVIMVVGTALLVRESRDPSTRAFPLQGLLIAVVAVVALVYAITAAGAHGLTTSVTIAAVAAVLLFALLVWQQRRTKDPILPPGLLRNRSFTGASMAMALTVFALMGSLFFLSQYLQSVLLFSPLTAGLLLAPLAVLEIVGALSAARVIAWIGVKNTLGGSLVASAAGLLLLALGSAPDPGYVPLIVGAGIMSVGLGLAFTTAADSIIGSLPVNRAGVGSALDETLQQFGAALGVAILGAVANSLYRDGVEVLQGGTLDGARLSQVQSSVQGAGIVADSLPPAEEQAVLSVAWDAFCGGMSTAMVVGAVLLGVAAGLAFWLVPRTVQETAEPALDVGNGAAADATADTRRGGVGERVVQDAEGS